MQQHQMPPAPPPPQAMQPGFPVMPRLVHDFGRVHLNPSGHGFEHNMQQPAIQVIQPPGYGHMPDPRSLNNGKPSIGYVGYTFTKHPVEHVGQRETWAIIDRKLMPASQADLKDQVDKHRKRGTTGLDQYNDPDMKGYKRKQIDELIRDCTAMDLDHRFEYVIASIKRDTKRRQSGPETSTMHVILKRHPRTSVNMQGPFMGIGDVGLPLSGIVDLSGADEYEKSSQNSSNGHKPGAFPFERHLSEPWVHVGHSDARPHPQHTHSHEHAHPHDLGYAHANGHADSGSHETHGLEQTPHHDFHDVAHDTNHGHEEKAKKHKDKEHKSSNIVHNKKHDSHKSRDHHSDSSSSSDSDSSSGDTDRTPDTIISSEGSLYHRKDKKYHKSKHHRKPSSHHHDYEPAKVIYREHKRKEPMRRLSSPPPSHGSRYRHESIYIEPGLSSRRRQEPIYPREHSHDHHRAMSFDDERLHDHDMRGLTRRPTVYRIDAYEEREERRRQLDREIWEREEALKMRERQRRDRDSERMFRAPRPRMDPRMHSYDDDHLRDYHNDRY